MLNRFLSLALAVWLSPMTFAVEAHAYGHYFPQNNSEQITLQVLVEGDASAVKLMVEELPKMASNYGIDLAFASRQTDPYEVRIIVTVGQGSANDPTTFNHFPVSFIFSSAVVMTRDGNVLFTSSQSSVTAKGAIILTARETCKRLYEQYEVIKNASRQHLADSLMGKNKRSDESPKTDSQEIADLPKAAGVYCNISHTWVQLGEIFAKTQAGGMGKAFLTWGISRIHINQTFDGPQAKFQLSEQAPTFYVVGTAVSNEDAAIVRLRKKPKQREVSIGSLTAFNSEAGYRNEDIIVVTVSRVSANVVKITPQAKLQPGEYLLRLESFAGEGDGYDFGITPAKR